MTRPRAMQRRDAAAGITLVEMLVVLAVIGVAAGATMLGVNAADRGRRAEAEAVRLARQLTLAVDEALATGVTQALFWDARGYAFQRRDGAEWRSAAPPVLAGRHQLRAPVVMSGDSGDPVHITPGSNGPVVVLRMTGGGGPWQVRFDGFSATAMPDGGGLP